MKIKTTFGVFALIAIIVIQPNQAKSQYDKNDIKKYQIENSTKLKNIGDGFTACSWTNDQNILLTKQGFTGLYLYEQTTNSINTISDDLGVGYKYQQVDKGNYILTKYAKFDELGKRKEGVKIFNSKTAATELDKLFNQSSISVPTLSKKNGNVVAVKTKDKLVKLKAQALPKVANKNATIGFWHQYPLIYTDEGLRLYKDDMVVKISDLYGIDAVISPDGKLMCYNDRGVLKIRDEDQNEQIVGQGLNASWLPNSQALVYQITEDDGQEITGSDIYIFNLNSKEAIQLTNTAEVFEEYPVVSKDNQQILYTDIISGAVYVGNLSTK